MTMFIPAPIFGGISEKEANFVDKLVTFIVDFPTWTLIGIALASVYGAIFIEAPNANTIDYIDFVIPFFHIFIFFSLVGLYWSRHMYVWLWRTFRKVFYITSIY